MRIILAASIVIASMASASAQSPPDRAGAADSGASQPAAATKAGGSAATAPVAPVVPDRPADFVINGSATIRAAPPRTPEQRKADEAAQVAWQARCRPTVVEDREGMRRAQYAESDCDLSRFNTAGGR